MNNCKYCGAEVNLEDPTEFDEVFCYTCRIEYLEQEATEANDIIVELKAEIGRVCVLQDRITTLDATLVIERRQNVELKAELKRHTDAVFKFEPLYKAAMQDNEELEAELKATKEEVSDSLQITIDSNKHLRVENKGLTNKLQRYDQAVRTPFIKGGTCSTTHSACDCVIKRTTDLEAELQEMRLLANIVASFIYKVAWRVEEQNLKFY